jgi:hypothetical protein
MLWYLHFFPMELTNALVFICFYLVFMFFFRWSLQIIWYLFVLLGGAKRCMKSICFYMILQMRLTEASVFIYFFLRELKNDFVYFFS